TCFTRFRSRDSFMSGALLSPSSWPTSLSIRSCKHWQNNGVIHLNENGGSVGKGQVATRSEGTPVCKKRNVCRRGSVRNRRCSRKLRRYLQLIIEMGSHNRRQCFDSLRRW